MSALVQRTRIGFTPGERALWLAPVLLVLLGLLAWAYQARPYQDRLAHFNTSLTARTSAQRQNIMMAVKRLDGTIVGRGERYSFNAVVGPRTVDRGFTEANAFMEGARTRSLGGGVCQVSSTMYAAIQETSLPIVQRVPHVAVVSSVPPGRDASVWYGQADLVWENTTQHPIRIKATADDLQLKIELWGTAEADLASALRFSYRFGHHANERVVWVFRRLGGKNVLLSKDTYRTH
ncbi:MAG: VanW family protein [Cyanobacteria bacterium RYN_339]|nr:VanW family protein [Cyanobacteria bacterium RYN_339]